MRYMVRALLATSVILSLAGCASGGATSGARGTAEDWSQVVTVRNDHWLDVVVYVVQGSTRFRLGTVDGIGQGSFRIPSAVAPANSIQLMLDPIGESNAYVMDAVPVSPGQQLEVRIGSPLSFSTIAVFSRR